MRHGTDLRRGRAPVRERGQTAASAVMSSSPPRTSSRLATNTEAYAERRTTDGSCRGRNPTSVAHSCRSSSRSRIQTVAVFTEYSPLGRNHVCRGLAPTTDAGVGNQKFLERCVDHSGDTLSTWLHLATCMSVSPEAADAGTTSSPCCRIASRRAIRNRRASASSSPVCSSSSESGSSRRDFMKASHAAVTRYPAASSKLRRRAPSTNARYCSANSKIEISARSTFWRRAKVRRRSMGPSNAPSESTSPSGCNRVGGGSSSKATASSLTTAPQTERLWIPHIGPVRQEIHRNMGNSLPNAETASGITMRPSSSTENP